MCVNVLGSRLFVQDFVELLLVSRHLDSKPFAHFGAVATMAEHIQRIRHRVIRRRSGVIQRLPGNIAHIAISLFQRVVNGAALALFSDAVRLTGRNARIVNLFAQ